MNNFNVNQNEFNYHQILDALQRQMAENDMPCDKQIILDGTVHRYSKDQKKNQPDEWYIGSKWTSPNNNQYITVTYGSWSDGSKFIFRSWDKTARFLDEKERREIQVSYQKRREEAEKLIEEAHHQVAMSAKEIWEKSESIPPHEGYLAYANQKGIQPIGVRFGNNSAGYPSLVLPLINIDGEIRSLQFISVGGEQTVYKTFLSGGEKRGNFMVLGTLENRTERFEVASFFGKTLLTGKDVPGNFLDNPRGANVLKSLVGGDRLSAEQKNLKRRFDIVGEFNIIITSNARLHLKLDSDIGAWQRRLLIIEFEKLPPKKPIPHFDDLLVATEGSGILNWMIEGAIILLDELETFGRIQRSKEQMQRVEDLLAESDSVVAFAQKCVTTKHGDDVTVAELSEAYTHFCQERGWKQETVSSFENQIKNVILQLHRVSRRNDIIRNAKNQRGFKHVALVEGGN